MKKLKSFSVMLLFVLALSLSLVMVACSKPNNSTSSDKFELKLSPATTEITLGETLNYSDFTLTVDYEDPDKTDETVTLTESMITDGLDKLGTVGTHTLTVTHLKQTTSLTVTVKPVPTPTADIVLSATTAEINFGEELDFSEFTVTVKYKDGTTPDLNLPLTEEMITDGLGTLGTVGTHELTVTAMGATAKLTVTVKPLVMTNAAMANVTKTYDGEPAQIAATGLPQNANAVYTYYEGDSADESKKVESMTDAGTYFVKAVVSAANYTDKELTATVTINPQHISVDNLVWTNTGYRHTGEEITLAATTSGLPDGVTYVFKNEDGGDAKATDAGFYTAVAHFTSTNKNYTVGESCSLNWKIVANTSLGFAPWYTAADGVLTTVTFDDLEDNKIVMHFGDDDVEGTVDYGADATTVTFPEATGYTLTVDDGVMTVNKGSVTTYLLSESALNNFVGEYSTLADDISVVLDLENNTLKLVTNTLDEGLTVTVKSGAAVLVVDDTDMALSYDETNSRVKFDGYKNPANFDLVDNKGSSLAAKIYLLTKKEVEDLTKTMPEGAFVDYNNAHTLSVAADKTVTYDGMKVQPYAAYYIAQYSNETSCAKLYVSINTNKREQSLTIGSSFYTVGSTKFIPADYKNFFGTYYPKNEAGDGYDTASANKVSFMEHESYYRIYIGSVDYVMDNGEISFALANGVLTATLTKGDADPVTVTFNGGTSLTVGDKTYEKVKTLFCSSSYYYYYNINTGKYIADKGNGKVAIYGTEYLYKSLEYTENGLEITIDVDGTDKKLVYNGDSRYIVYDGVMHVYESLGNVPNGRANATYTNGEDSVTVSNTGYTVNIGGVSTKLSDVVYSVVDDGNNKGRTVIQAVGKAGDETYTVLHYSLAAIKVNGVVYTHSTFVDIMGSEFKPAADSDDVFAFGTDGKMTYRGEEIFLNGANSYTNFNLGNVYYSFDVQKTSIAFNDQIVWNVKYYFTAYFDFNGVYVSADNTKIFAFDETTVYYDGTNSTSFKAKTTETGALITVSGKDAVFSKAAGGATTVVFDGVTYTKVADFDLSTYYGTYTVFDGSANGSNFELKVNPGYNDKKIVTFVMYNGNITPVVDSTYDSGIYLIKNTDATTSTNLPILAVQKKFVNLLGTVTFNGKPLQIVLEAVPKENSTDYVTAVNVKYDGETTTISGSWTWKVTIKGVEYIIDTNDDADTKDALPLRVFEAWWDDIENTSGYTYNGKTLTVTIGVDASGATPVPALKFNYDGADVDVTITEVEGGRTLTFTKDGINYKGVIGGTPAVAVYTQAEFDFFFADNFENTVNGKTLVLSVKPTYSATEFNLEGSTYDGKDITFAKYLPDDNVVLFANADGYYAYDIVAKQFYTDIVAADDAPLLSLNYRSNASYGQPLYYTTVVGEIASFDKTTGKVAVTVKMGGYTLYPVTSITKVEGKTGEYIVVGKTYNSSSTDVSVYLIIDGSNVTLAMAEEYNFPGTYTVNEKSLVITKTADGKYTASYDGSAAAAITPDFSKRSFILTIADKTYMVTWTYATDFTFTVSEVSADALKFTGSGSSAYISAYSTQDPYDLTITYTGNNSDGKPTFSIKWEKGYSSSGNTTGVLADDGQKIIVDDNIAYNKMNIYLNNNSDKEIKYIMLGASCQIGNFVGKFTVGMSEVVIGLDTTPTYDYDDELDGYERTKLVITVDGKSATVNTSWDTAATTIEFTCDGTTYTATYAEGSVTVAEKAA